MFGIEKNGEFVKDFSNGKEFVSRNNVQWIEKYTTKKAAIVAAQAYGAENGKGYKVVAI